MLSRLEFLPRPCWQRLQRSPRLPSCCLLLYLNTAGLRRGPGKMLLGPGKVLDFFVTKRVGTLSVGVTCLHLSLLATLSVKYVICFRVISMSKHPSSRTTKEPSQPVKTAAVQALADSTQERTAGRRKSTRLTKRQASDDSKLVSRSKTRRREKASKRVVHRDKDALKQQGATSKMGRQIPLTFTAQGKTQCEVVKAEPSDGLPVHATKTVEDVGDTEDSNVLMREWLERKADRGNLPGLQWYDKSRQLVKISWKHGSKSGWTANDSQVFISWAKCTGF